IGQCCFDGAAQAAEHLGHRDRVVQPPARSVGGPAQQRGCSTPSSAADRRSDPCPRLLADSGPSTFVPATVDYDG
ncbi:MAG: hypothetical protein ACRDTT_21335, partial [Pseudonocardiaceae bacterium]